MNRVVERLLALADQWDAIAAELDRKVDAIPDGSGNAHQTIRATVLSIRAQELTDHAREIRTAVMES